VRASVAEVGSEGDGGGDYSIHRVGRTFPTRWPT
jgi:hypothetical protein